MKNKIFRFLYALAMRLHDYSMENRIMKECLHDEGFYTDNDLYPQELCRLCGYSRDIVISKGTWASHSRSKIYEFYWEIGR